MHKEHVKEASQHQKTAPDINRALCSAGTVRESVDGQLDCGRVLIGTRDARNDDGVGTGGSASRSVHSRTWAAAASHLQQATADQEEHEAVAQQLSALRRGHPERAQKHGRQ